MVLLALFLAASSADANFRGNNGLIAFDSWTGTSQDIGVFDPGGTGSPTFLTTTPDISEATPRWSRDGTKIVYMVYPQSDRSVTDIWIMDADGQHKTQLTNTPRREEVPAWTADGRIVFCGQAPDDLDDWNIYLMNADGSGLTLLTQSPAFDCWPSPAPSGNQLAFTSDRNGIAEIFTMTLAGKGLHEVTSGLNADCVMSDWSPSGNDIVFGCEETTGTGTDRDIWMAHRNQTKVQRLTSTPTQREAFPSWSPDGNLVVFGRVVTPGVFNIFSLDPDTGEEQLLLADSPPSTYSVAYPSWQPVGPRP
jgi:TolB protein